jgi:hypothetical protein
VAKLDEMFDTKEKITNFLPDVTGVIGMYAHGNEPCHHVAYLYNYAGQPWKTQARTRQVATMLYNNSVGKVGDGGRDGTEIDIYEKPWLDDRVNMALHWDGYGKEHKSEGRQVRVPGIMEGFHTYALWWSPEEYVFSIDGKELWRTKAGGVCQVPLYIKLSDEIGTWAGDIKKANLPDAFVVDYVRVYDLVEKK